MSKRYFGTDGIRGVAGEPPLDNATVFAIGLALGDALGAGAHVVMGEDTRASSGWIAETLAAALADRGVGVAHAGVLPTPGVAHLAASDGFAAGVMISASHNPYQDNGIKCFDSTGYKLPDTEEASIENGIEGYLAAGGLQPRRLPRATQLELVESYVDSLAAHFASTDFSRLRIVVDCAHGAASAVAAPLFARLGLAATLMADRPDGRNINAGVGALHPDSLGTEVRRVGADAGVALDGDADRAILVDGRGQVVNGDAVLLMAAREMQATGQLQPPVVVGTVMTNLGLELALGGIGIQLERTAVGDKYVLERMRALGACLGGEPSGHIIFGRAATTGDGLLTALHCFALMAKRAQPLAALCGGWTELPQRIINIKVREKAPLESLPEVQTAMASANAHFGRQGRILVRYSGTEKLARVMVEAVSADDVDRHAHAIATALRSAIGE
ncbi:MAG TPA: phosphoglucosamine mutase [Terriglobales bacterium]|nr:phosphoglucosamine mutase [Terriglobales bacterium]